MNKLLLSILAIFLAVIQLVAVRTANAAEYSAESSQKLVMDPDLKFNPKNFREQHMTMDGRTIRYRAYENIVYVKHPVDTQYQVMNIYIPDGYFNGQSIEGYSADTAPIFLPNTVGGYMPGRPDHPGKSFEGKTNASFVALSKGYVVAAPGARGRTTQNAKGEYTGKAPACIVDLKAAVRYLRYNDKRMPGDAEKIISNGTSAGGALSALLAATGNSPDYAPYLAALGAADARDDIFAASCYCPITNLDHADAAYEWLFQGLTHYKSAQRGNPDGHMPPPDMDTPGGQRRPPEMGHKRPPEVEAALSPEQIRISNALAPLFPTYLNSLKLRNDAGELLTLDATGNGNFREFVKSFVLASAQIAQDNGADLSGISWITLQGNRVKDLDFAAYIKQISRMKTPPAFDSLTIDAPENGLFGTKDTDARHFTDFGEQHSQVAGALAEKGLIKLMNPMYYLGDKSVTTAKHWRIRHGSVDRDTSLPIPVILATSLKNKGYDVDFAIPWNRPHSGDYDLDALFAWMAKVCR